MSIAKQRDKDGGHYGHSSLVRMVQQAFGWTDAEVDALFAEADAV